jgi:hypothetical protein
MRKVALVFIILAVLGVGLPYALNLQLWAVVICVLAALLWLDAVRQEIEPRANFSFLGLAVLLALGVILRYPPLWLITDFAVLLIAWDLTHFANVLRQFSPEPDRMIDHRALILAHTKRLGMMVGLGWALGVLALNMRFSLGFTSALLLGFLVFFSLQAILRNLTPDSQPSD